MQYPDAGIGLNSYESAFPADASANPSGSQLPGFPGSRQGIGFLTSPIITDVTGSGQESIVEGGDSSSITAVGATGTEASGFPKFTSGWDVYAPSAGDLTSNGHVDLVATTREGYLYAWATPGKATANSQWWGGRHDEYNSGNYGVDSRPPGALRNPHWSPESGAGRATASFTAPGDNWYDGEVAHYLVTMAPSGAQMVVAPTGPAGTTETVVGPPGTTGMQVVAEDSAGNTSPPGQFGAVPPSTPSVAGGYRQVAADGGVFSYGNAPFEGSLGGSHPNQPVAAAVGTPDGQGYLLAASDGGVFTFGDAAFEGSLPGLGFGAPAGKSLNRPIVGMAATPDGKGYWLVASDGGVFSFGDADFHGSTGGKVLNAPVVGMAATPDGLGYWLVASDGGVFSFGDAAFHGSTGGKVLNAPVVAMAATPAGLGYWLVASDGGVFSFGDADFHGSTGGKVLNAPVVAITPTADGAGYWLSAGDGGVFSYGDAVFRGSTAGTTLAAPVVAALGPPLDPQ